MKLFIVFSVILSIIGSSVEQHCGEVITSASESGKLNIYDERGIGILNTKQTYQVDLRKAHYISSIKVQYFFGNSSAFELILTGYLENVAYVHERRIISKEKAGQLYTFDSHEILVDRIEISVRSPYQINETNTYLTYEIRGCPIEMQCGMFIQPISVNRKSYHTRWPRCPYILEYTLPGKFNITEIIVTMNLESAPVVLTELDIYGDFVTSLNVRQGKVATIRNFSKPIIIYPVDASTDRFWLQPWPMPDCSESDLTPYMTAEIRGCPYDPVCNQVLSAQSNFPRSTDILFDYCAKFLNYTLGSEFYVTNVTVTLPPIKTLTSVDFEVYYRESGGYVVQSSRIPLVTRLYGTIMLSSVRTSEVNICLTEDIPNVIVEFRGCA